MARQFKCFSATQFASVLLGVSLAALPGRAKAERYALLIGVAKYETGITQLPYDIYDVAALQKALTRNGGYEEQNVIAMTTNVPISDAKYPIRRNIVVTLTQLSRKLKPQDSLLLYFSGHGVSEGGKQYLLGADASIEALSLTALSVEDLQERLNAISVGQLVTILDTCRNDPSPPLPAGANKAVYPQLAKGLEVKGYDSLKNTKTPAYMEIFSCSEGERAQVFRSEHQNSVFTYYLVEGIQRNTGNRRGQLKAEDLYQYAAQKVKQWADKNNVRQNPFHLVAAGGDIVISDNNRPVLPAKLNLTALPQDVTVETQGKIYSPVRNATPEVEIENEREERVAVTLNRPGYLPQTQQVTLASETETPVTAKNWIRNDDVRLRLQFPTSPAGYQWQMRFEGAQATLGTEGAIPRWSRVLPVYSRSVELILEKSPARFVVGLVPAPKTNKPPRRSAPNYADRRAGLYGAAVWRQHRGSTGGVEYPENRWSVCGNPGVRRGSGAGLQSGAHESGNQDHGREPACSRLFSGGVEHRPTDGIAGQENVLVAVYQRRQSETAYADRGKEISRQRDRMGLPAFR